MVANERFEGARASIRSFTKSKGWVGGVIVLLGVAVIVVDLAQAPTTYKHFAPTADYPNGIVGTTELDGNRITMLVVAAVLAFFGLIFFVYWSEYRSSTANKRATRIKKLTEALNEAMKTITSIQIEVEEGQRALAHLQSEISTNRDLAQLTSEQSKAVEELVRKELRHERWPALWVQLLIGVLLIGVGVLISHL